MGTGQNGHDGFKPEKNCKHPLRFSACSTIHTGFAERQQNMSNTNHHIENGFCLVWIRFENPVRWGLKRPSELFNIHP